jgi:hypothetical protein
MIATTWVEDGDFGAGATIPMQTGRGMNSREHFRARAKRVKAEREVVAWTLRHENVQKPPIPCSVLLTRFAPSRGLDDDNLAGALKSVRDEVAAWLGVDDGDRDTVRYRYGQARGAWAVRIQFGPPVRGAQHVLEF